MDALNDDEIAAFRAHLQSERENTIRKILAKNKTVLLNAILSMPKEQKPTNSTLENNPEACVTFQQQLSLRRHLEVKPDRNS